MAQLLQVLWVERCAKALTELCPSIKGDMAIDQALQLWRVGWFDNAQVVAEEAAAKFCREHPDARPP